MKKFQPHSRLARIPISRRNPTLPPLICLTSLSCVLARGARRAYERALSGLDDALRETENDEERRRGKARKDRRLVARRRRALARGGVIGRGPLTWILQKKKGGKEGERGKEGRVRGRFSNRAKSRSNDSFVSRRGSNSSGVSSAIPLLSLSLFLAYSFITLSREKGKGEGGR